MGISKTAFPACQIFFNFCAQQNQLKKVPAKPKYH